MMNEVQQGIGDEAGLVVCVLSQTHQGNQSLGVFVLWKGQDRSDSTSAIIAMSVVFDLTEREESEGKTGISCNTNEKSYSTGNKECAELARVQMEKK